MIQDAKERYARLNSYPELKGMVQSTEREAYRFLGSVLSPKDQVLQRTVTFHDAADLIVPEEKINVSHDSRKARRPRRFQIGEKGKVAVDVVLTVAHRMALLNGLVCLPQLRHRQANTRLEDTHRFPPRAHRERAAQESRCR